MRIVGEASLVSLSLKEVRKKRIKGLEEEKREGRRNR
jgi:hypothetical protein